MIHNYPKTKTPASIEHLRLVAPKQRGSLDWWASMMNR